MSWIVAAATVIGGTIGAVGSNSAANTQRAAAQDAAGIQKQISDDSLKQQREIFDINSKLSKEQFEAQLALYNQQREEGQQISKDEFDAAYKEYSDQFDDGMQREQQYIKDYFGVTDPKYQESKQLFENQQRQATQQMQPFLQAGAQGLQKYQDLLGLSGNTSAPDYGKYSKGFSLQDFQQDPGYSFRLGEGIKALDRSAAARGGLLSGQSVKAAERFGQDLASQEYQNAFNRYQTERQNALGPLEYFTNLGKGSAQDIAGYGKDFTANTADTNQNYVTGATNALRGSTTNQNALGMGYAQDTGNLRQNLVSNYTGIGNAATQGIGNARSNYIAGATGAGNTYGQNSMAINQNYGNQASDLRTQQGNAQASGIIGGTNAMLGGLNSIKNYYQDQDLMNRLGGYSSNNSMTTSPGYARETVSSGYYPAEYGPPNNYWGPVQQ